MSFFYYEVLIMQQILGGTKYMRFLPSLNVTPV